MASTVAERESGYSARQIVQARRAQELRNRLGCPSARAAAATLSRAIGCEVTAQDVMRAEAIYGKPMRALKGATVKRKSIPAQVEPSQILVQKDQYIEADLFFVKKIPFLLAVLLPMGMCFCDHMKNKEAGTIFKALQVIVSDIRGRGFGITVVRFDGEKGVAAAAPDLADKLRLTLDPCGAWTAHPSC